VKRPEREILGQEKNRLKRSSKKAPKSKVGPFSLWGRFLAVFGPVTLGAVILASFFTPMFAIERIEVSGTERLESG
jgi:cell division septal protein FtsQ